MKTKRLTFMMLLICGGVFAMLSCGFPFAYLACENNVILYQANLTDILDVLRDLLELFAWAVACSLISYACFFRATKRTKGWLIGILCALLFLRRALELLMQQLLWSNFDLFLLTIRFLTDLLVLGIALGLVLGSTKSYFRQKNIKNKAKALFSKHTDIDLSTENFYPFTKIFSKKNPLQFSLLKIAVLLSATKLISRLLYDIDYGMPQDFVEVLIMLAYYLSDVIMGVIFYIFCIFIFRYIFSKQQKTEKKPDEVI